MAKLRDMKRKGSKSLPLLAYTGAIVVGLTGCSVASIDAVRPELNQYGGLLLRPGASIAAEWDLGQNGSWGDIVVEEEEDTAGDKVEFTPSGVGIVEEGTDRYAPFMYRVLDASWYTSYLDEKVYVPLSRIIKALPSDASSHLYFHVFHSGYNAPKRGKATATKAPVYSKKLAGSFDYLGGITLPSLAVEWLPLLESNQTVIARAREAYLDQLDTQTSYDGNSRWEDSLAAGGAMDIAIRQLWSNQRLGVTGSFASYVTAVEEEVIGTIPGISFKLKTSSTKTVSVTVNPIVTQEGNQPYRDRMSRVDADRLFTTYNQYADRDAQEVEVYFEDDCGALFGYIDGYSKTLVYMGAELGYTLADIFGDNTNTVYDTIRSVVPYTNCTELQSLYPDALTIDSGTKGED